MLVWTGFILILPSSFEGTHKEVALVADEAITAVDRHALETT